MKGYTIALDDFIYHDELRPLIALARYIKLELPKIDIENLPKHVETLRHFKLKLLAEKVETYEQFELCKSLGVDYFQGYFLSRPETLSNKRLPVNKLAVVQILAKVHDPETTLDELERLVAADVALSYRILRFVNSAQVALNCKVDTVRRAILMTGLQQIRAWVSLIVLARLDDNPPELLRIALLRSRLCEKIAKELGRPSADSYATAGLFSTLDALLDKPISEILGSLPLKAELASALLDQSGPVGEVLRCVLSAERADWAPTIALGVDEARTSVILREAIAWTEENSMHLSAKA
jgi:EAL and modified HD-GYP domain-containing signal transduction protein